MRRGPRQGRRARRVATWATAAGLLLGLALVPPPAATAGTHGRTALVVSGDVAAPARYTRHGLAALPQVTLPDQRPSAGHRSHTLTGVPLESLVLDSAPVLPDTKNALLRVTLLVTGRHHRAVAVALGELNAGFGNHSALLVLAHDGHPLRHGPTLAFPGDSNRRRTVHDVARISVTVTDPAVPAPTSARALVVTTGTRTVQLSAARLASLPARTRTVTFQSSAGVQSHTETGPSLRRVLRAAHVRAGRTTTVAAIGDDGYVATVTPGEQSSGRRLLQLSLVEDGIALAEPRLVVEGDVKGGRYVSGLVGLSVTGAHARR